MNEHKPNEHLKVRITDSYQLKSNDTTIVEKNNGANSIAKTNIDSKIEGWLTIKDNSSGEVLLDKKNAIHFENFSIAIANSMANIPEGNIHEIHFGNGGSAVSGTGAITYFPPNVSGINADLYNPTYFKIINNQSPLNSDPLRNFIEVKHIVGTTFTDIVITATLANSEPAGQEAFDTSNTTEGTFVFDEIGIKTFDSVPGNGDLLTHVVFNPIQKSLNREIEVVYTIRISL